MENEKKHKIIMIETYLPNAEEIGDLKTDLLPVIEEKIGGKLKVYDDSDFKYDPVFFCEDGKITTSTEEADKILVGLLGEESKLRQNNNVIRKLNKQGIDILVAYHRGKLGNMLEYQGRGYERIAPYIHRAAPYSHEIGPKYPFWTNFAKFALSYKNSDVKAIRQSYTEMIKVIEEDKAGRAPFITRKDLYKTKR